MNGRTIEKQQVTDSRKRWVTFGQNGRVTGLYVEGCAPAPEGAIEVSSDQYDGHLDATKPDLMLTLVGGKVGSATLIQLAEWKKAEQDAMLASMSTAQRIAHDLRQADPEGWDAAQRDEAALRAVANYRVSKMANNQLNPYRQSYKPLG